ncbi:band 4.1-like protein 4 [Sebastes umbrosus]|uniref:band 4.1-like protein 4 n=1 Tax=Sebastes umbrosus TaxID=72105 RepID=UPI00189D52CA|nr:band 4.1-like protein 4 [Sebastes umbrosus]XP_037609421.1 band 4.1-like protein 4 [Sebastes umbrosus]XP_037609422.1 band 4.1-like protein 4 [Sebastes umbrosus]
MACFRGNWEEFYGEVLLLDERKITLTAEQGIKKSSKVAAILQQVFSHLNVVEVEFFGLRFCDNKQQTHWLDPSKTLSQHRDLVGPPYIFYFGVKFYVEDPSKLKEETTRYQFYLQVRQDVHQGRLRCPPHLRPRLSALMLHVERGDQREAEPLNSEENQEEQHIIYQTLSGVSRPQAQCLFLSLCSSLQMFGVQLFAAYGENHTEFFLGPTPVGVVVYKNKVLVGKYFWQRITKLHFRDETFELRVVGRNGSETSFYFQTLHRSDCKRLWRCCVEHHAFFRMSESNPLTCKLKFNSVARSPSLALPRLNVGLLRNKTINNRTTDQRPKHHANQTASVTGEPMATQAAPPAVQRSAGAAEQDDLKPSAPWENSGPLSGLFNPKFPPSTKEEEEDVGGGGGRPQRRSRSLDGDQSIRQRGRRSRSRGNTSSGSESQKTASNSEQRRRRKKSRDRHGNRRPDSRSRSPDALTWKHIQKQLMEPDGLTDRQMEEIPYKEVRVSGEPIRTRRSPRGRRHRRWASASDLQSKMDQLVPPLPVTKATNTSVRLPTSP